MAGGKLCVNMEIVGALYNLSYLAVMFNASHGVNRGISTFSIIIARSSWTCIIREGFFLKTSVNSYGAIYGTNLSNKV